jgi:hypothetical protein
MPEAPPKFASFRAKPAVPSTAPSRTTSPDRSKAVTEKKDDQPIRKRSLHRHHHSRRRRDEEQSSNDVERKEQSLKQKDNVSPIPPQEIYEEPSDLFIVDRRGDLGNVKYGYNERYKVPDYREPSLRKLLGDNGHFFESRGHKGSPLVLLSKEDRRRLRDDETSYVTSDSSQQWTQTDTDLDFIVLNPGKKRKRSSGRAALVLKSDPRAGGKYDGERDDASATSDDTPDASESDGQATEITIEDKAALKAEKVRLSALVREQPHNVAAWLEFVSFQEKWTYQGQEVEEFALPREEQQSLADVKLSIYKKALAVVPVSNPERETLLLGMMTGSELVLEGEKLMAKWQSVVADNPSCLKVGQSYLNYMQSTLASFDFNASCDLYAIFLGQLSKSKHTTSLHVYSVLRFTVFMSEAGHHERAIALWQAIFELGVFTTDARTTSWHAILVAFETFWDEERPRVGELDAYGWQNLQTPLEIPTGAASITKTEARSTSMVRPWLQQEIARTQQMQLPGRVADDSGDSDDIHHLVLFDDIKPFLFDLRCESLPIELVNALLCFMHLPPLPNDDTRPSKQEQSRAANTDVNYWADEFLRNEFSTSDINSLQTRQGHQMDHYQTTLRGLFSLEGDLGRILASLDKILAQVNFVRNLMCALLKKYPAWSALAEYYLAVELHTHPGAVRKKAKALLKAHPSSLRLYNAYALMEARLGKPEMAEQILSTAISMSATFDMKEQCILIYLCHTRLMEATLAGHLDQAFQHCLRIDRAGLLRDLPAQDIGDVEHYLNTGRQRALANSRFHLAAVYSTCIALLYYLSSSSISTAIEAYSTQCAIVASYGPAAASAIEYLHQERAVLMKDHMARSRPYKPSDIRLAFQDSIGAFPTNTIFLQLYAETESRFRIDDRVRQLTRDVLSRVPVGHSSGDFSTGEQASNLIIYVFGIETELRRTATAGSTRHAVRAAFERAVADRRCRHSATIWMMYLDYELDLVANAAADVSQKGEGVSRVKDVFYRGLRCLPWAKMWYLRGMEILLRFGLEEEVRSLAALMVDKGLRVLEELAA